MYPWLLQHPPISTYGVCIVAAVTIAWLWARTRAKRSGIDPSLIDLMVPVVMASGLLGAWLFGRIADAVTDETAHSLVLVGVLVIATAAGIVFAIFSRIPLGVLGDICAAPAALGIAIGRLGCFFAGCCYGKVCPVSWLGVRFPVGSFAYLDQVGRGEVVVGAANSLPVYPVQLLEAGLCAVLAVFVWRGISRVGVSGERFLAMGMGYAGIRFAVEFLRGDNSAVLAGMTFSQVAAILIVVMAVVTGVVRRKYAGRLGLRRAAGVDLGVI